MFQVENSQINLISESHDQSITQYQALFYIVLEIGTFSRDFFFIFATDQIFLDYITTLGKK